MLIFTIPVQLLDSMKRKKDIDSFLMLNGYGVKDVISFQQALLLQDRTNSRDQQGESMNNVQRYIKLDWERTDKDAKGIPASVLTKAFAAAQRIVNMIANEIEGFSDNERDRMSQDRIDKYLLYVYDLKVGSAHSTFILGDPHQDTIAADDLDRVAEIFLNLLNSIKNNSHELFNKLFKNRNRRMKAIGAVKDMIPDNKLGIRLTVGVNNNQISLDSNNSVKVLNEFSKMEYIEDDVLTVIGKLTRIYFDRNEFQLRYALTRKNLKVKYSDDDEKFLMSRPRDFVQIRAKANLNNNMAVNRILEVYTIENVDLSPIVITDFQYEDQLFRMKQKLELEVTLDDTEQLYLVCNEDIALNLGANTREELIEDIQEKLAFLWLSYIENCPDSYGEKVERLRSSLRDLIEVDNV